MVSERSTRWEANRVSATIYYVLYLLMLPVTVLGYVIWLGGAALLGRRSGVSATAQGPLSARYFQHRLGVRKDEAASRLMLALPNAPTLGLQLFAWPMLLAHWVTSYVPKTFWYPFEGAITPQVEASARVTFFDAAVERYARDVSQFVILGAGFDTRAFRLPAGVVLRSFEVDTPKTQSVKKALLRQIGVDMTTVAFAPADFENEDWFVRLVDAGFDPSMPTLFLWEGVMMYLHKQAVEDTMRKVASTGKGSIIAFDYLTTEPLESSGFYWRLARASTRAGGEPLSFGIDSTPPSRERLVELLRSCGLALAEQRTLGDETDGKRAWGGFAIATVP